VSVVVVVAQQRFCCPAKLFGAISTTSQTTCCFLNSKALFCLNKKLDGSKFYIKHFT